MVKELVNDSEHIIIEILHFIPEFELEYLDMTREDIINAEIEIMKQELKEDYPGFGIVYAYPQRNLIAPPRDENYEKAIHKLEKTSIGPVLKVVLRAVAYK